MVSGYCYGIGVVKKFIVKLFDVNEVTLLTHLPSEKRLSRARNLALPLSFQHFQYLVKLLEFHKLHSLKIKYFCKYFDIFVIHEAILELLYVSCSH